MGERKKTNLGRALVRQWQSNPLFSTGMALLVLVILQTLSMGFQYASFGEWLSKFFQNWLNILLNNSYVGMIALGMTFVIISGGIDLAVGSTLVAVGAMVMVMVNEQATGLLAGLGVTGAPAVLIGVIAGLLLGLLLGELNGVTVTKGRVPPFIVTLGTMKIFRSVTQYFMQSQPGVTLPDGFKQIARAVRAPVLNTMLLPILYWLALAVVLHVVAKHTAFGRYVYAVGSNERTTRLSGVNVDRVKRRVYALMGVIVAVAAIVQIARIGSMDYASAGSGYEMDAIAAAIIGGTSMSGGRGSIVGTVLGTLIIAVMNNLLTLVGVDPFLREAFKGAIVVAAVLMQRKDRAN